MASSSSSITRVKAQSCTHVKGNRRMVVAFTYSRKDSWQSAHSSIADVFFIFFIQLLSPFATAGKSKCVSICQ